MRILVVGKTAGQIKEALLAGGIFDPTKDVVEVLMVPEGTPSYDMVVGDNCARVYYNTVQFLGPFIQKAKEAVPGEVKPKKKAAPKKKVEKVEAPAPPAVELGLKPGGIPIVTPAEASMQAFDQVLASLSKSMDSKTISALNETVAVHMDDVVHGAGKDVQEGV